MPRSAPSGSGRESSRRPAAPRPSCATCATRSSPGGCALPATPPRIRSRRSSSAWSRAARPPAFETDATTASCARSSPSGATRRRSTAAPRGSSSASTRRTRATCRGLIRDEVLTAAAAAPSGRRAEHPRLALTAGRAGCADGARPRRPRCLAGGLEARRPRRRRRRGARVRPGLARAGAVALDGDVRWGGWVPNRSVPGCGFGAGARAIVWQAAARRFRICSWMRRFPVRSARPGRSSCAVTTS